MNPFLILLVGMVVVVGGILVLRLHAFLALLLGALVVAFLTPVEAIEQFMLGRGLSVAEAEAFARSSIAERIAQGFGRTSGQIGIVIAMASVIGIGLLESGAADRIVRSALRLFGERRAPQALVGSSFLLGIPVFFDTVFYLMIPLAKMLRLRTGRNYLFYILAIVAGGTMAHSLVPPTPGPLFIALELGVDLGVMIVGGILVGLVTSTSGYLFARWAAQRWEVPLRESEASMQQLETLAQRKIDELPSLLTSLLPILLPVALIALSTGVALSNPEGESGLLQVLHTLGEKNMALILGAVVALMLLLTRTSGDQTVAAVRKALTSAGIIILIIGAGGAFGQALQQTGIGTAIEQMATGYQIAILPLAFGLTALVRTAQGSATVAMITAAGAFAGVASVAQLGFHPVYLALAIGCGSKPIWWMNDSGFWVVSQMSGMSEREGLQTLTPTLLIMGIVGLFVVLIAAWLFPLV